MRIVITNLCLLLCMTGCSQDHWIYLKNKSALHIDSVILDVKQYKLKFIDISPGEELKLSVPDNSVNYKHDINMVPYIHIKDSAKIIGQYYYSDLGDFLEKYRITIDEKLKVRWEILSTKNEYD